MLDNSIQLNLEKKKYGHANTIIVHINDATIREWCLLLCLLHLDLIDVVVISNGEEGAIELSVHKGKNVPAPDRVIIEWNSSHAELWVSEVELKAWVYFFMRYYRDGAGDVDHIDVETVGSDHNSLGTDLILRVPKMKPPKSVAELLKLIGHS